MNVTRIAGDEYAAHPKAVRDPMVNVVSREPVHVIHPQREKSSR